MRNEGVVSRSVVRSVLDCSTPSEHMKCDENSNAQKVQRENKTYATLAMPD